MKELNYLSACRSGNPRHPASAPIAHAGSATTVLETLLLLPVAGPPRRAERVRR
jgi:hypothetical protein